MIIVNKGHTEPMETEYERACRRKFYEMLETEPRISGYSQSQLLSVMVVMECDSSTATGLLDQFGHELDWSEATWTEMRDHFRYAEAGA